MACEKKKGICIYKVEVGQKGKNGYIYKRERLNNKNIYYFRFCIFIFIILFLIRRPEGKKERERREQMVKWGCRIRGGYRPYILIYRKEMYHTNNKTERCFFAFFFSVFFYFSSRKIAIYFQ